MNYSPLQFRRVQHEFLEEFQFKSLDFYDQNINSNHLIEYKKILNHLKTRKISNLHKKEKNTWLHSRGKSTDISLDKYSTTINQTLDQEEQFGFYLTENVQNFRLKRNETPKQNKTFKQSKVTKISRLSKDTKIEKQNNDAQSLLGSKIDQNSLSTTNENLNIDNLNDRIYGQYSVLQCLRHEQSQVQEAIFCFKKRIIALEQHFSTEQLKSKQVDRLLWENNNQMLRAKHTNQQVKSAFLKTKKHFDLDFQVRHQIQQKFNQKNKQEFEQSIVNHIYVKKMRQHISEQEKQLYRLDEIRHSLEKKERKYLSIYNKQQELYKMYQQISSISPPDLGKIPIVSILDKDFDELDKISKNVGEIGPVKQKSKGSLNKSLPQMVKKKLSEVVNQILFLHRQIKNEQSSKISEFNLLINQRDEKQSEYNKIVSRIIHEYDNLFEHVKVSNPDRQKLEAIANQLASISLKSNFLNSSTNGIEQRLKFYISKQLHILQIIIDVWMKNDKLSNKYFLNIFLKFNEINSTAGAGRSTGGSNASNSRLSYQPQSDQKQMCMHDSKTMLISYFENWQDYIGFLDILHQSPYIYRFMNKNKLQRLFKRIIKTKLLNKTVRTEDIFQKALQTTFDQGRQVHSLRVQKLLQVFNELYSYLTKTISGLITLNCSINYQILQIQETQPNQASKLPSRDQLQRNSLNQQSNNERYSLEMKYQNPHQRKQIKSTENKHVHMPASGKDEDIISKLKKRRQLQTLNIHDFYQNMREQIQKVNKISPYC